MAGARGLAAPQPALQDSMAMTVSSRGALEPAEEDAVGASQLDPECETAVASQQETARAIIPLLQLRQTFLNSIGLADMGHVFTSYEREEFVKRARAMFEESEEQAHLNQDRSAKRKRWHQHVQQVCGSKRTWEVIAFTGRFDEDMLEQ